MRWNAAAWSGSLLGMTSWMVLAAAFLMPTPTGWLVLSLAAFLGMGGIALWLARRTISFYVAVQIMIVAVLVVGLFAIWLIQRVNGWAAMPGPLPPSTGASMAATLGGTTAGLMLVFHLKHRYGSRGEDE